jgi:DNA polymerase III subunit beta
LLKFAVQTPDLGGAGQVARSLRTGTQLHIGFDATNLMEILKNIPTVEVRLMLMAPERAATLVPEECRAEEV